MVDFYSAKEGLLAAEAAILSRLGGEVAGKAVLDMGVGAGRTAPHLAAIAASYVGIDYSQAMIDRCRARYPGLDFRRCDAVRLDLFPDGSFDAVFFTFNGIDHAGRDDRGRILREVRRVLRAPGIFVFSSHHLGAPRRLAFLPRFVPSRDPFRLVLANARGLLRTARGIANYLRHRRHERRGVEEAELVDEAHDFATLMYYTTVPHQIRRLEELGFSHIEAVARDGSPLHPQAPGRDPWIYYVARKL